jgi:hypothetical protein
MSSFIPLVQSAEAKLATIQAGHSCLTTSLSGIVSGVDISTLTSELQTIIFILEIFLDLHSLDSSEFATDPNNLSIAFNAFFSLLGTPAFNIKSGLLDYPGSAVDAVHRVCIKIVHLFASKYEEDFRALIDKAVNIVWVVLQSRDNTIRHDGLMCVCLKFFADLASKSWYKNYFDQEKLAGLVNNVIVRHVPAREDDIDAVTTDDSYLERELISTANDEVSKRGAVIRLVESLFRFYQAPVEILIHDQIIKFQAKYQSNPDANWGDAESAILLAIAMGSLSDSLSTPTSRVHVPMGMDTYVGGTIVPLLNQYTTTSPPSPLLVISSMKALAIYRYLVPTEATLPMLKVLLHYISSDEHIIASYSAYCLSTFIGPEGIVPLQVTDTIADALIQALLNSLNTHPENQYILAAIITTIGAAPLHVLPIASTLTTQMFQLLAQAMKSQTNQRYVYLLFELLAIVMRLVIGHASPETKVNTLEQLEGLLFPSFQQIISDPEMVDLHTYVFTMMAMFLEEHVGIPAVYLTIWPMLLQSDVWKTSSNIPSLVRFISAFLHNDLYSTGDQIGLNNTLTQQALLGIYQKLLASTKTHFSAFKLSQALAAYTTLLTSGNNLTIVLRLQFAQLSAHKESVQLRFQLVWLYSFWIVTNSLIPQNVQNHRARAVQLWARPHAGFIFSTDALTNEQLILTDCQNGSSVMVLIHTMNNIQRGIINAIFTKVWVQGLSVVDTNPYKKLFLRGLFIVIKNLYSLAPVCQFSFSVEQVTQDYFDQFIGRTLHTLTQANTVIAPDGSKHQPSHGICTSAAYSIENRSNLNRTPDVVLKCSTQQIPFDAIQLGPLANVLFQQVPQIVGKYSDVVAKGLSGGV